MLWNELSWPQISQLDRELPVVLPLGSLEQHGLHLPLFVDTIQVQAIAQGVEARLPKEMVLLPTLWLGCSEHHRDFPGTISVPASIYAQVIQNIARSILRHGFRRLFFLNGHGGNELPASHGLTELIGTDDQAEAAQIGFASWWQLGSEAIQPPRHGMTSGHISHACEYETSLMLAIRPDLVAMPQARDTPPALKNYWVNSEFGGRVRIFRRFHRFTAIGSMGSPTVATKAKGESLLEALIDQTERFIREFATWPDLPILKGFGKG